jgi:hypothetical protein
VRRHALDVAVVFVLATGASGYVSLAVPADRSLALHVYVLFVGALVMIVVLSGIGAAAPRARRSDLRRALDEKPAQTPTVPQLARVEREVTLGIGNAHDFHTRLLPHLREIAEARLERQGRRPGPDTLGPWWDLLRPDRPQPAERFGPGIRQADLRALVSYLEKM